MAIYVDEAIWSWRGRLWCHMWSDKDLEELNAMADKIGLLRSWIQTKNKTFIHYDITATKRIKAIRAGAQTKSIKEHAQESLKALHERAAARQQGGGHVERDTEK